MEHIIMAKKMTATEMNQAIRNEGIVLLGDLVNHPDIVPVGNGEFAMASKIVDGRAFTIKVTAKAKTFDLAGSAKDFADRQAKAQADEAQRQAKAKLKAEKEALKEQMEAKLAEMEEKKEALASE